MQLAGEGGALALTASDGPRIVAFESFDNNSPYGPVIGNVSLGAVPEASTWAMLLASFAGLGLAGYCASRRDLAVRAE